MLKELLHALHETHDPKARWAAASALMHIPLEVALYSGVLDQLIADFHQPQDTDLRFAAAYILSAWVDSWQCDGEPIPIQA